MSTTDERDDGTLEATRLPDTDGDDIAVISTGSTRPPDTSRRRRRALIVALAVVVVLVAGALAIVARNNGSKPTVVQTLPNVPAVAKSKPKPKVTPTSAVPVLTPTSALAVTTVPATLPPKTRITLGVAVPPHVVPPSAIAVPTTVAPPKQYGASVLTWSAPHALTIVAGKAVALSVIAHNGTDGIVTLPHPLSCAPRLDHSEVCSQNVQLVSAGQSAGAQYTISALGIAPGSYTLNVEGVLTIGVTVTAPPA